MAAQGRMGRYLVLERIGQGGMGVVHRAYDPHLERHVAVKLLHPGGTAKRTLRLLREAQAMARLSDPGVVQVYDAGVADGKVFIAMELVVGTTLYQWLRDAPRRWEEVLDRFLAAGRGLAAAHAAGVIHRDFKPQNVLLSRTGRVLVSDFGLARPLDGVAPPNGEAPGGGSERTLTLTGAVLGTPRYMAPEQREGARVDARADQYSLCVALTEALSRAGAPDHLLGVAARGLAPDPAARFATIVDLLAALEAARAVRPAPRRWAPTRLAAVVVAAAAIWLVAKSAVSSPAVEAPVSSPAAEAPDSSPPASVADAPAEPPPERELSPEQREPDEAPVEMAAPEPARALPTPPARVADDGDRRVTRPRSRSSSGKAPAPRIVAASEASPSPIPQEEPDGIIRDLWTSR